MDVTEDEFETFIEVLGKVSYLSTPEGAQQIVDIICEQADLQSEFQVWMRILTLIYDEAMYIHVKEFPNNIYALYSFVVLTFVLKTIVNGTQI